MNSSALGTGTYSTPTTSGALTDFKKSRPALRDQESEKIGQFRLAMRLLENTHEIDWRNLTLGKVSNAGVSSVE